MGHSLSWEANSHSASEEIHPYYGTVHFMKLNTGTLEKEMYYSLFNLKITFIRNNIIENNCIRSIPKM